MTKSPRSDRAALAGRLIEEDRAALRKAVLFARRIEASKASDVGERSPRPDEARGEPTRRPRSPR